MPSGPCAPAAHPHPNVAETTVTTDFKEPHMNSIRDMHKAASGLVVTVGTLVLVAAGPDVAALIVV